MKILLKTSLLLIFMLMIGCSSSDSKKVDNFLDDYEKVVVKWEDAIADGTFDEDDADLMNKTIEEMEEDAQELKKVTKWSTAQQERYAELSERIMGAVFKSIQFQGFEY
jgi:hypothetical protein